MKVVYCSYSDWVKYCCSMLVMLKPLFSMFLCNILASVNWSNNFSLLFFKEFYDIENKYLSIFFDKFITSSISFPVFLRFD